MNWNLAALALPLSALAAVLIDRLCGEPRRWHPLVGFGHLASALEKRLNRWATRRLEQREKRGRENVLGLLAWLLVVAPWVAAAVWLQGRCAMAVDIALLTFALGAQSLREHAEAVVKPLMAGDLEAARQRVGWMVSRETSQLDESGVAKAGVESVLENGNDAIFGTLFWFAVAGGPGALLFRLANTLDAMWGYRTERFKHFGWAAARIDDGLNWLPARLTALTYAVLGHTARALACWRSQAPGWDSPNAGPVMAAGAGSLQVSLGGAAIYHGQEEIRPPLGEGPAPVAVDLRRAIKLVQRSMGLWLLAFFLIGLSNA